MPKRIPMLVAGGYVWLVPVTLVFGFAAPDEFGYGLLPAMYAGYPWFSIFGKWGFHAGLLKRIVLALSSYVLNTVILYVLFRLLGNLAEKLTVRLHLFSEGKRYP